MAKIDPLETVFRNAYYLARTKKMTKDEFANKVGTSRQNLDRMRITGDIKHSWIVAMADVLDTDIPKLYTKSHELTPELFFQDVDDTIMRREVEYLKNILDMKEVLITMKDNIITMKDDMIKKLTMEIEELRNTQ